jgi:hypothetical protein
MDEETTSRLEEIPQMVEGIDYYFEDGLMVLAEKFLKDRGYCCGNGCRHCPYFGDEAKGQSKNSSSSL